MGFNTKVMNKVDIFEERPLGLEDHSVIRAMRNLYNNASMRNDFSRTSVQYG